MVMRAEPARKKFHSSDVRCQCSSRMAPGWMVTRAAAKLEAMGKVVVSMIFTEPPGTV